MKSEPCSDRHRTTDCRGSGNGASIPRRFDPLTSSILANSEDGKLYRWIPSTNVLSESVVLTSGIGEAYTPTVIGGDGTVYAINDATLFAVGR
jgi:hypothetical protein